MKNIDRINTGLKRIVLPMMLIANIGSLTDYFFEKEGNLKYLGMVSVDDLLDCIKSR